ncbi:hypothetical protein NIES22_34670 [Calothrix brevissima NIES-22]|nr:hypothetical protein NIES22_34670 [Calothrix brevissima NIES-22]
MSIITNRLKIDFHVDAIERDFVFIRLKREKKGKWWGAEELDYIIGNDYKAMAVGYAQYAYAMFDKKSNNIYELRQKLGTDPKFANVSAIEVKPQAVYNGNDECICEVTLARLLINSLGASRSRFKDLHFSNLTGTLLKVPALTDKLYDPIGIAEITINRIDGKKTEFLLNVSVASYRKKVAILKEYKGEELRKILKRPEYVFHSGTASLRRWLPSDGKQTDATKSYIKCSTKGKRRHTNFIEFGSIKEFENSRAGIFHQAFKSIQEHLSEYMSVDFASVEIDDSVELTNTLLKKPQQLHSILDGQPINIIDTVQNEDSAELAKNLKESLLPYITDEKLITFGKRDKKGALNFRIIHDAEFYEKMGQEDEYLASTDIFQRQHLTIESTINISDSIVKTSIEELLIKRDISSKKLNLFEWSKLGLKGVWTFAAWDEEASHVIFMEIQPNGNFEFHTREKRNIFNWERFDKYKELMTETESEDKIKTLEGLVISDTGDINQIFRTDEITIPDLSKIETIINEVETKLPEDQRTGNALADLLEEFMAEVSTKDNDKLIFFTEELRRLGNNELDKSSFRKLINENLGKISNVTNELRSYLLNRYDIRLIFSKQKENLEDLFNASLHINYFGETEKEAYYFVGERSVKDYSFKDACHLRKIVAVDESKLIFRQLLKTMDVDFVRTGQSTVVPFPFKYIREYQNFDIPQ